MAEQKLTCPFMTGAALLIQDISRMIVDPSHAKIPPGGDLSVLATPADHRVLCLKNECALWVKRQRSDTGSVIGHCGLLGVIQPFTVPYFD
jgi:hypothetical protein